MGLYIQDLYVEAGGGKRWYYVSDGSRAYLVTLTKDIALDLRIKDFVEVVKMVEQKIEVSVVGRVLTEQHIIEFSRKILEV